MVKLPPVCQGRLVCSGLGRGGGKIIRGFGIWRMMVGQRPTLLAPNNYYSPSGGTTGYGTVGSIDDSAESYAYTAYMDSKLAYPTDETVDPLRMMIIHLWVDLVH